MPRPPIPKPAPLPRAAKRKPKSYLQTLRQVDTAGYGVILTRSREPRRVLEQLRQYAFTRKNAETNEFDTSYREWDCVCGFVEHPADVEYDAGHIQIVQKAPNNIGYTTDIVDAICAVRDVKNHGASPFPTCFAVFNYPHFQLKESPEFIVTLKAYCHSLPTTRSRIVLVVPEGFTMPSELEDDITILDFAVPTQAELIARFSSLLSEIKLKAPYSLADIATIATAGLGMTELDFDQAVTLAITELAPGGDCTKDIEAALVDFVSVIYRCKTEAVKRTNMLELIDPIPMSEIGGMENAKDWIIGKTDWFSEEAREFGLRPPRGGLMVGIPGGGKSLFPKAVSDAWRKPLIRFDIGKVFGKYVGESEQRMDLALKFIQSISPCIVWVDEIDKSGLSGDSVNESSKRVFQKLLTEMQEMPDGVFWIMSANYIEGIPVELLRPGRMDIILGVVLPNEVERLSVMKIHLAKGRQDPSTISDLQLAVKASNQYTGAEIEQAVKSAIGMAWAQKDVNGKPIGKVTGQTLKQCIEFIKPQSVSHKAKFDSIIGWCKDHATPASKQDALLEKRVATAGPNAGRGIRRIG